MNAKELEQMRAEDRRYGEQQKGKPKQKERRKSNQVNFNRFSTVFQPRNWHKWKIQMIF